MYSFWYFMHDFIKLTGAIPTLLYFRPKRIYVSEEAKKKIKGGAIVISNHIGMSDPICIQLGIWYRRHRFICKKEICESGYRFWFRCFLSIPIDSGNFSMQTFKTIVDELQKGHLVSMFPEGQIYEGNGEMGAFKSGAVLMALQGKAPIVPVYLQKRKSAFSRQKIVIGEAVDIRKIYSEHPKMSQIEEITRMLQKEEERMKDLLKQRI